MREKDEKKKAAALKKTTVKEKRKKSRSQSSNEGDTKIVIDMEEKVKQELPNKVGAKRLAQTLLEIPVVKVQKVEPKVEVKEETPLE